MKDLKAFINKDVLKRMRHNNEDIYLVWCNNEKDALSIERSGCTSIKSFWNETVLIMDISELLRYIKGKINPMRFSLWKCSKRMSKEEIVSELNGFNGSDVIKKAGFIHLSAKEKDFLK